MKTLTYKYDSMVRAGQLLNSLVVSGSSNFRALAEIANILDSGTPGETFEKEEEENSGTNNMVRKEICQKKLEK